MYKKILVTGGCGFIGSAFVRYMRKHWPDTYLYVIDKGTYAANVKAMEDCDDLFRWLDINDVSTYINESFDAIVNFAAESHVDRSISGDEVFMQSNFVGVGRLLNFAKEQKVGRFLQVSTDEVYGDNKGTSPNGEGDRLEPRNPYSATKAAAEHMVMAYHETHGLDVVITRGSNTYGPYQYPEKIIPLFIKNLKEDKQIPVYGNGSAIRDYMYVDDHAAGIAAALMFGSSGQIYNLATGHLFNGNQVAEKLLALFGKGREYIKRVEDRKGHDYLYHISPTKAKLVLGWEAKVDFDKGLKRTVDHYLYGTS